MTVVAAHELTETRLCKAFGCEREVRAGGATRGPYALLCDEHYEAQRRRFSAIANGQVDPGLEGAVELPPASGHNGNGQRYDGPQREATTVDGTTFERRARDLAAVGRKLDKAVAAHRRKQAAADASRKQVEAAAREWKAMCARLGGDA